MRPLALAHRLGARDAEIRGALAWLLRANLLGAVDRAEGTDPEVRVLANWAGVAAPPVASVVDWGTIIERLAGQPAALSVALAFAESTVAPGEQTPVTVPQLVVSARYSDRTVKGALARLVEEGVLVRGPRIGARSRYAFSEAALGLASFPDAVDPPETREATSGTSDVDAALSDLRAELQTLRSLVQTASPIGGSHPMARTPHGEPATGATTPVYLEIQGIRVALPPGATLNLEPDATGQLWYRIGNSRLGPIAP